MKTSILIATYGDDAWRDLAWSRAFPSAEAQDAFEVLVHHDPDGTIAAVRNELGKKAKGDWLLFLDADDELGLGYIQYMRQAYEWEKAEGPLLLTPSVQAISKGRNRPPRFYHEVAIEKGNWLVVGTMIERSLFLRIGGFPDYPHGFEDWGLWYKAVKAGARIVKVKRAIYRQYVNANSKHRQGWRDRKWQVQMHQQVAAELEAWQPA